MTYFNRGGGFNGSRNSGGSSFNDRGPRPELYKAVCAECGRDCQVPFKPNGSRPIYCSSCFEAQGSGNQDRPQRSQPSRNSFEGNSRPSSDRSPRSFESNDSRTFSQPQLGEEHLRAINIKLDRILDLLTKKTLPQDVAGVVEKKVAKTKAIKKLIKKSLEEVSAE